MKLNTLAAASVLAAATSAVSLHAQTSGVSHPESLDDTITTSSAQSGDHYRKPSPAVPLSNTGTPSTVSSDAPAPAAQLVPSDGSMPGRSLSSASITSTAVISPAAPAGPVTYSVTETPHSKSAVMDPAGFVVDPNDPTSGVVTARVTRDNELAEGTLLRAALDQPISSDSARRGNTFTAHLTADVTNRGRVLLPSGSQIRGRITEVRQAKRFGPGTMMRLQPDSILLPDGTQYTLSAQLIDFDRMSDAHRSTRISGEGEIHQDNHVKTRVAGLTFTTGTAAVAGAVLAGGVGAAVGAGLGAGAGLIWWSKQDHVQTLDAGTVMVLDLDRPLFVGNPTDLRPASAE